MCPRALQFRGGGWGRFAMESLEAGLSQLHARRSYHHTRHGLTQGWCHGAHPVNRLRRGEPLTTRSQSLRRRVCNSLWNKGCYWSTEHTRSSSREIRRDRTLRREGQSRVPTQTRPIFSVHATTVVGSPSASGVAGGGATLRVSVKTASSGKLLSVAHVVFLHDEIPQDGVAV